MESLSCAGKAVIVIGALVLFCVVAIVSTGLLAIMVESAWEEVIPAALPGLVERGLVAEDIGMQPALVIVAIGTLAWFLLFLAIVESIRLARRE